MSIRTKLYQDILAHPDRDGPRRRYAAYLESQGEELGEFIRLALHAERLPRPRDGRTLDLHNKFSKQLAAQLAPWIISHQLDRGLVALVKMDGQTFLDHGKEVFARAPIQHLDLVNTKPVFAELMANPLLARVQTLQISNGGLGDAEAALLAESRYVYSLLRLDVGGNQIGEPGIEAIAASPNLSKLRRLEFMFNLVESPVPKYGTDDYGEIDSSMVTYNMPLRCSLLGKYGMKPWLDPPPENQFIDSFRMCDAGE